MGFREQWRLFHGNRGTYRLISREHLILGKLGNSNKQFPQNCIKGQEVRSRYRMSPGACLQTPYRISCSLTGLHIVLGLATSLK